MSYYRNNPTITETRVAEAFLRGNSASHSQAYDTLTPFYICEEVTELGHEPGTDE